MVIGHTHDSSIGGSAVDHCAICIAGTLLSAAVVATMASIVIPCELSPTHTVLVLRPFSKSSRSLHAERAPPIG